MRLGRVAVALLLATSGCAVIMQQPPKPNRAPGEVPVCSSSRGGVALDGVLAVLLGAGALAALAGDEPGAALGLGAVGGIYTWSAVSGHRSAGACEAAQEEYQLEVAGRRPARRLPVAATHPDQPARPELPAEPARPAGPPIEAAAPPEPEAPPAAEPAAEPPAAEPPAPRDWSDFWVEVAK